MGDGRGGTTRRDQRWGSVGRAALAIGALIATAAPPAGAISGSDTIRSFVTGVAGPIGINATADGSIVIPAPDQHLVRLASPAGVLAPFAGTGVPGFAGDGGPAGLAQLNGVVDSAVDAGGNVYLADRANHRIRRVAPDGIITTIAGNGINGFSGDGGPATAAALNNPVGVAVDGAGNVYVADEQNRRVRRVAPDGTITTIAGTGAATTSGDGGPATLATIERPIDVRTDGLGNVYIADSTANRIRRITPDGIITTVAGDGQAGATGDGGAATAARLAAPIEIAPDAFGNLYIADSANNRVRRVNTAGIIETVAGTGEAGSSGDGGPARDARLNSPSGVVLDADGDLFIAERLGNAVRVVRNPDPATVVPEGSARCATVPPRRTGGGGGRVALSAEQLLINQRISQAAVRRVNAIQGWLDARLVTDDLCGGAFVAQSFGAGITTGATSAPRPEALEPPRPRPVDTAAGPRGSARNVRLGQRQLLINQRISQAAVRRVNALTERLDRGLTGGDLRPGAVTAAKIALGLAVVAATPAPTPAPSSTKVSPSRTGPGGRVTLSAKQIRINQRISQAAVRRSNALLDRLRAGFSARDFRPGTITFDRLAPAVRP